MGELSKLKGLGPKSEQCLNAIGIYSHEDLAQQGAVRVFVRLQQEGDIKPSLNFLYALVGALEDKPWNQIAREEKDRLLTELDGYRELEALIQAEGSKHKKGP